MFDYTIDAKIDVCSSEKSKLRDYLLTLPSVSTRNVKLDWLLSWPHISTIYSGVANFEKIDHIYYERYVLEHTDGGNNTLDLAIRSRDDLSETEYQLSGDKGLPARTRYMTATEQRQFGSQTDGVLVILAHGLAGGSHENYIRRTITDIHQQFSNDSDNVDCVAFNARGCARSKVTSSTYWSAEQTTDIAVCIEFLAEKFPNRRLVAIGFSLGANILVNYLARAGSASKIHLAISISNPWHLDVCNSSLEASWLGRLYSRRMASGLQRLFFRSADLLVRDGVSKKDVMDATSIKQFDSRFTAKIFGFESANAYHIAASSGRRVKDVTTNLIIVNAQDDPMAINSCLPYAEVKERDNLCMLAVQYGGHIGWYGPRGERWFTDLITQSVVGVRAGRI